MTIGGKITAIVVGFLCIVCVILILMLSYTFKRIDALKVEKNELKTQVKGYENVINNYEKAKEEANGDIEKIKTIVKTIKEPCDCYNAIIPDKLLNIIRGKEH